MTVLCSICSKHNLISEGPRLSTLKFITEIKDTNNSSAKKYVAKISLRPLLQGRWLHGRTDSEKKSVIYLFFFWLEEFHSIVLSILMKLTFKKNEKKKEKKGNSN